VLEIKMVEAVTFSIIQKAIDGDTLAFRQIVEQHQGFAYTVSYRMVGNEEDAEDIVQEAFIRLWNNLHKYKPEVKLSTWLYKIITNLCLDFLKSARAKQQKNRVEVRSELNMNSISGADDLVNADELHTIIQEAASVLTPAQKAVFILRDLEQLTVEEVSEILSMSAGNIKSNLHLARRQVAEVLTKYYQVNEKIDLL
jgi:RNA polymerase sigma-70 factor, ECF subfamily